MTATAVKPEKTTKPAAPTPDPIILGIIPKGELRQIPLDRITEPNLTPDRLPRAGDAERIAEIARSMREVGQLQPLMVEELADGRFARVFGRRRLAAARLNAKEHPHACRPEIAALVVPPLADDVRRTIVAVENMQRQDLTPAEEAVAVAELLAMQAFNAAASVRAAMPIGKHLGKTVTPEIAKELAGTDTTNRAGYAKALLDIPAVLSRACELVAAMLCKPVSWVRDRRYIGRFGKKGVELILSEKLPLMHAREIAKVADPEIREDLAVSYAAGGDDSVSDTEPGRFDKLRSEVSSRLFHLDIVPWNLSVPVADKPACDSCPHNSANNPGLFDHGGTASEQMVGGVGRWGDDVKPGGQVCTNHACFGVKLRTTKAAVSAAAKKIVDDGKKLADVIKPFMAEKALNKKVKERRERGGSRKKGTAAVNKDTVDWNVKYEAERKYRNALVQREQEPLNALNKQLKSSPYLSAASQVLTECTKLFHGKPGPRIAGILKAIANANSEEKAKAVLLDVSKEANPRAGDLYELYEMTELVADAFGIKLEPAPKLADFMPKKEAPKPAAKKAAKKGGGRAAKK